MASQSQSSTYSRSNNKTHKRMSTCYCGHRPVLRTSSMVENPGRRFWGCVNFQVGEGCDYFTCADAEGQEPTPQVAKLKNKVAILKGKLSVAERNLWVAIALGLVGWMVAMFLLFDRVISPFKILLP
ncbi:hypothetical protein PIB30_104684 [Stylosanthes scabra]|uniref:Zinc finger GRF-type domain-containing protein n=1 Tax=Stylosanthes scabra TaxID=79078 RepID=A0ABU6QZ50_9FABA|nr:hypothetical protein [Stylosanthes scabra]